jgi:hypothetical protein
LSHTSRRRPDEPGPSTSRKVALLGSRQGLEALRRSLAQGRDVVLELEPGTNEIGALAAAAESIKELIVLRAADAFPSVESFVDALKRLGELGIAFESLEEPWLSQRASNQAAADELPEPSPALSRRAVHFLDLSIERLEADRQADADRGRRDEIRTEIGKVIAQLLILGPYAVVVAILSQSVLNAALLDPELLVRRLRDFVSGSNAVSGAVTNAIPDALRGVVFSAFGSLLLVIFRGTSIGLRADIGGAVFMGAVTVSVYGLTAGFGTGIAGALIAIPGLVLAAVLAYEFTHMVLRITAAARSTKDSSSAEGGRLNWPRRLLTSVGHWADPTRSVTATALFVGIPLAALLLTVGAAFTNGGVLFLPARAALFALVGWAFWACLVTPGAVRLPLWSTLAWAAVLLLLSAATTVTAIFATVIVLLLAGMVFELVFRHDNALND